MFAKTYRGIDDAASRREEYGHRYFASEDDARAEIEPGESLATRAAETDGWQYRGYQAADGFRPFTGGGREGHAPLAMAMARVAELNAIEAAAKAADAVLLRKDPAANGRLDRAYRAAGDVARDEGEAQARSRAVFAAALAAAAEVQ